MENKPTMKEIIVENPHLSNMEQAHLYMDYGRKSIPDLRDFNMYRNLSDKDLAEEYYNMHVECEKSFKWMKYTQSKKSIYYRHKFNECQDYYNEYFTLVSKTKDPIKEKYR
jgi:hypothetical protein